MEQISIKCEVCKTVFQYIWKKKSKPLPKTCSKRCVQKLFFNLKHFSKGFHAKE